MALTIAAGTEPHADDGPPDRAAPARPPRPARRSLLDRFSGLFVLAALIVVFSLLRPDTFMTVRTLRGLAADQTVTAIAAIGVLVAFACGAFDLSVGAVLGLAVVMVTWLQAEVGLPAWLAVVATLGLGVVVGAVNGLVVTVLKVNSFIATLAMASIVEAVIYGVTDGRQIVGSVSPTFLRFGQSQPFGVPAPIFYMAGIAVRRLGGPRAHSGRPARVRRREQHGGGAAQRDQDRPLPVRLAGRVVFGPPSPTRGEEESAPVLSTPPTPSRIIRPIAHAGTGSGPGTGWAAVTSRRGFGSHVSEGVRQAGGFAGQGANALVDGGLRKTARNDPETSVLRFHGAAGRRRVTGRLGDRHRRGAEASRHIEYQTRKARPCAPLPDS